MAENSESTPFLASNDHLDDNNTLNNAEDEIPTKTIPVNAHFKRPIRILTTCVSVASGLCTIFLTAAFIIIQVAPFPPQFTYNARWALQELGTYVFISFILSTLMIFLQLPIIINLLINLILTILTLSYSGNFFGRGWPQDTWCYNNRYPYIPNTECAQLRLAARILISIGGGLGFLVGLFYLVLLLLRIVTISKTKSWKLNETCPSYPSGQYTFQITLGFLKKIPQKTDGENGHVRDEPRSDSVDGRLIDA